jgi:hypothetical protein
VGLPPPGPAPVAVYKRPPSFLEEPLILPAPVLTRWKAGRALYKVGTTLTVLGTTVAGASGITNAVYQLQNPPNPSIGNIGNALAIAGSAGNIGSAAFLISGLSLQHSALGMVGQDSGRAKFIAGVVFTVLGLASVASGYVLNNVTIPDQTLVTYLTGYGGTGLLTMGGGILISDAANLNKIWERLGMRPAPALPPN